MLSDVQRLLAEALCSADPHHWLQQRLPHERGLDAGERAQLQALRPDGLLATRFLVRKLRLQRLLAGSRTAVSWSERDPAAFAAAFRDYDAAVPPRAVLPSEEAAAFERHLSRPGPDPATAHA